jgi:hypothetical protein
MDTRSLIIRSFLFSASLPVVMEMIAKEPARA